MTDDQFAELLAFSMLRSMDGVTPVPVNACLHEQDAPRLLDADPGAPHLDGPTILLSDRDFDDLKERLLAEYGLREATFGHD